MTPTAKARIICPTMPSFVDRISARIAAWHAKRVYERFVADAADAIRVQDRVLADLVRRCASSGFGRDHRLDQVRDYADFARRVPVRSYDALKPYIDRVVRGEPQALLGERQKVLMFALTSGTTAEPKHIPVTEEFLARYRAGWNAWGLKALLDHPQAVLRGILQMASPMDERLSPVGTPCGAITGLTAKTQKRLVRKYYVTPTGSESIADAAARYYVTMRFAAARDVAWLIAASPATLIRLAESAAAHAEAMIRDIHDGTIHPPGPVSNEILASLRRRVRPDRARAEQLDRCLGRGGALRPKDYWQVSFLACWTGGSMGLYLKDLAPWYGDVPIRDIGLIASEGRMTIPVADGTPAGILDVASHFHEFIPADQIDAANPAVLRCHELDKGGEYFLVLTTASGLFRYSIMDLVRVCDYHGQAPVVEFLSKGQRICSLAGEKLTENQVVLAGEQVERDLSCRIGDFALCPCWGSPPGYTLYLDGNVDAPAGAIADAFDRALCAVSIEYASKRKTLRLAGVHARRLACGHLAELDRQLLAGGRGRAEQFKHRFLYNTPGADTGWPALPDTPGAPLPRGVS
jgi:hypothetical protein